MPPATRPEEAAAWRAEMATIDLARLRWMWIVAGGLTLLFIALVVLVPEIRAAGYGSRVLLDLTVAAVLIALGAWARRQPPGSPWRMRYVWLSVVTVLLEMNSWYFESLAAFGQNSDYVLGVISVAAIVLAPPRAMAVALGANHALFCAALLWPGRPRTIVIAGLVDSTIAVVIGWFVGWFLYRAREAEFSKTRALAASNAELREVMAIAAHDLRSPLLGLRDLIGLAEREPAAGTGTLGRMLALAKESCGAMVGLVSRLVEAHMAEEAEGTLQLVSQDLRDTCTAVGGRLRTTAEVKGQNIHVTLPSAPAVARIDATAFAQVMENLVGNALKYSPPGATVECALFAHGTGWRVEVRDEGPSVPAEERGRLFQKFHRGSARPTGGESSTGLGLFIVRRLTEAMGGRVSHAPRDPRGSVFCIELPAG